MACSPLPISPWFAVFVSYQVNLQQLLEQQENQFVGKIYLQLDSLGSAHVYSL